MTTVPSYVIPALESGTQWPTNGVSVNITYSFWQNTPLYDHTPAEHDQFQPFTATMITDVQQCLAYIQDIANITFQQVTDPGTLSGQSAIQIGYGMALIDPSAEAYTYYPDPVDPNGGDVWANRAYFTVDDNFNPDPTASHVVPDDYDWMTLWHETGHALGLKHPFNDHSGDPPFYLPKAVESDQYSIMSYTHSSNYEYKDAEGVTHDVYPETYMPDDIAAIQALYGANMNYNSGDNNYVLSPDHVYTIWDGGGNDTMDGSALGTDEIINLQQGQYSTINENTPISQNIAIAYGTVIENAIGGSGNDTIFDNSADNYIQGGAGDDAIHLSTGNDTASGGAGNDTIFAGTGNETIDGGTGMDTVVFNAASSAFTFNSAADTATMNGDTYTLLNDEFLQFTDGTFTSISDQIIDGTALNDVLKGGIGNDTITGDAGNDTLSGFAGNDTLDGGAGIDTLIGGGGNDTYIVDLTVVGTLVKLQDIVTELTGQGDDTIILRGTENLATYSTLTLPANVENLDASQTGSTLLNLTGSTVTNILTGNDAANTLDGGGGGDTLIGGLGDDTYILRSISDVIIENASAGNDTIVVSFNNTSTLTHVTIDLANYANVENIRVAGTGLFNLVGSSGDNILTGNASVNTLTGNGGNDTFDGGAGADTMIGGTGNDTYTVDNVGDVIIDTGGNNAVIDKMTSGTYTLASGINSLIMQGTAALHAVGNGGADTITGNSGANVITDGGGASTLIGGAGSDTYFVSNANDVITEAAGTTGGLDLVNASVSFDLETNAANVEKLTLTGTSNVDATGNDLNNLITGNSGDNTLDGGAGVDTLMGGLGNDTYIVDVIAVSGIAKLQDIVSDTGGTDTIVLRAGDISAQMTHGATTFTLASTIENMDASQTDSHDAFNITGNTLNNVLTANDHGVTLNGMAGADTLIGGAGNDFLEGGLGHDTLTGNGGVDTFVIQKADAASANNADVVTDFHTGIGGDVLDIHSVLSGFVQGTSDPTHYVEFQDSGPNENVLVNATGSATGAFIQVATLNGLTGLDVHTLVTDGNLLV